MKLKNPFTAHTRELFYDARYTCFMCGSNGQGRGGMELHHITGRQSNSALNAAPLCKTCHGKVGHTDEEHKKLFERNLVYLKRRNYRFVEKDFSHIRKNVRIYKQLI